MPVETLNCPMCGAPTRSDAPFCEHCGARLATVACPSCFGLIFQGAKFCSHCGAKIERAEVPAGAPLSCPRCRVGMQAVEVGTARLRECPKCEGIWADADSLRQICADREEQAAVLGMPAVLPAGGSVGIETNIRYVPCPACGKLMNRVNFARCSGVVVDVCQQHGTWFDRDELRRIVEFIRAGGLEKERLREIEELDQRRRQLESARALGATDAATRPAGFDYPGRHLGISLAASVLNSLFR
jgi:Zn-finger nucleic acid-binding protein